MPRKKLVRTSQYYYHITTRSNHKEWFTIPLNEVWDISIAAFKKAQREHPASVGQYVLMSNHYHLLIKTPNDDIDKFMYWFNRTFSAYLRKKSGKINRMFGSNYKWSIIYDSFYLQKVVKYIYQNPLRAGLVTKCEEYPFSTLHYKASKKESPIEVEKEIYFAEDLDPINESLSLDEVNQIRSGLKKTRFKPNSTRKY